MGFPEWDQRHRLADSGKWGTRTPNEAAGVEPPAIAQVTALVAETAGTLRPGKALDLACGAGRNAIWLAQHGWQVTAVDGSAVAIEILRRDAASLEANIDARIADLEQHQ